MFILAAIGLASVLCLMVGAWLVSLKIQDVSIVDRLWGMNFVVLAGIYFFMAAEPNIRQCLVLMLVVLWGSRLSWHIHFRNSGHGEDYRYQAMRSKQGHRFWWYSLFSVFFLQGLLAWLIGAPLFWIFAARGASLAPTDFLGLLVWGFGFYFEVAGDRQLKRFKEIPLNRAKVLDQGLWSLTRHPNYFGDALQWWGLFGFALALSWGWVTFFGPLLMTLFLRYVSGVTLLEKTLKNSKPTYAAYCAKTPAFVPRVKDLVNYFLKGHI